MDISLLLTMLIFGIPIAIAVIVIVGLITAPLVALYDRLIGRAVERSVRSDRAVHT